MDLQAPAPAFGAPHEITSATMKWMYLDPELTGSSWLLAPGKVAELRQTPASTSVPGQVAASDLVALGTLLRDTYSRYPEYAAQGVDVQQLVERHAARVRELPAVRVIDAFGPAVKELQAAVPDSHFNTVIEGLHAQLRAPELARREYRGPTAGLDDARMAAGAVAVTGNVIPLVRSDGSAGPGTGSIVVHGVKGRPQLEALGYRPVDESMPDDRLLSRPGAPYSFDVVGDTGFIRLADFDSSDPDVAAALDRFISDAPRHREVRRLVIDVRGNGGGQDTHLQTWARSLRAAGTRLADPVSSTMQSGRPHAISIWNAAQSLRALAPDQPGTSEMVAWAESTRALWPLSERTNLPFEHRSSPVTGTGRDNWAGDMYVLVDRRTASAGETSALMLRDMLGAKVVGERTAGALFGLNVATYELPGTRVSVPVPSMAATFTDPRVIEGGGIPIDVALEDPAMPAMAFAHALQNGALQ